jgi:hypothetical protein
MKTVYVINMPPHHEPRGLMVKSWRIMVISPRAGTVGWEVAYDMR